ncbi:MAG: hypothetical protein KY444_08040 [Gemmatimonadetes bacterium]|nr:hypothetical protein [Gemmatimonadota bacterium]
MLGEADDSLTHVLWRGLRDVRAWTEATADERRTWLSRDSGDYAEQLAHAINQAPELEEALRSLATLRTSPRLISLGELAHACQQVYDWADTRGIGITALLYAEAWGALDSDNPIASGAAGRMARRSAEVHRAEIWYDRAYMLAARAKNRREQIRALIGRGGLVREMGRYAEARMYFGQAANMAGSTRRHRQAAEVQHELLTIAAEEGQYTEAEVYMRAALREYPIHHRALPWLAHDWAFLLVRLAYYQEARVLLEAVVPHVKRPDLQVVVWGTLGRAAAGCGDRAVYDEAREQVLSLCGVHEEYAAAALAHLAAGAQFFSEWALADQLAGRAVVIARKRHQGDVERGALEILDAISLRRAPPAQAPPSPRSRIYTIQRRMLARLNERLQPRRREVVRDPEAGGRPDAPPAEGQPTGPRMDPGAAG